MEADTTAMSQTQFLSFRLGGEEYAVRLLQVREILQYEDVTRVPTTPPWIRGVMNLRGQVVPIVDLAVKFGLGESQVSGTTCIVIVEVDLGEERAIMGVIADSVSEVIDLGPSEIEPPPAFGTRIKVEHLQGMGKVGKGLVLILDIDRVLSTDELLAASDTAGSAAGGATPAAE